MASNVVKEVDGILKQALKHNREYLDIAKIEPISPEYKFSTNGIYFFCGKMGSGKSYTIMRSILITERIRDRPLYDRILFSSTSGTMDQTVESIKGDVKTPMIELKDTQIMDYLTEHIRQKLVYYGLVKFIKSDYTYITDEMADIIKENKFAHNNGKEIVYDTARILKYFVTIVHRYNFKNFPSNTLLILDDYAGHPLLQNVNSPLNRLLTKTRHNNITAILAIQTWRFVHLNFKRLCTDIVIWSGYSEQDFELMIKQTGGVLTDLKALWERYKSLPTKHSHMIIHVASAEIEFVE